MKLFDISNSGLDVFDPSILASDASLRPGMFSLANDTRFNETYFSQPLTTYAVGYRDPNDIQGTLDYFAPGVQVGRRFEYKAGVNIEEYYSDTDDLRPIGSDFKRVDYTKSDVTDKTDNRGLTYRYDLDQVPNQNDVSGFENTIVARIQRRLLRNELRRAVTLISAGATNTAFTWDTTAGKDPDGDVLGRLKAAADSLGGRGNRVMFGDTAWYKRMISHRAQNLAGAYDAVSRTLEMLPALYQVDQVRVSKERYQSSTSAKTEIVNNLVLLFQAQDSPSTEDATNVKRFWTPTDSGGMWRVYRQQLSAKIVDISVEYYSKIKLTSTAGLQKLTIS